MATTNLGRVGLVPKGAYSDSTAYKRLDVVSFTDGNTYAAIADVKGVMPTDTTKWKKIIDNDTNLAPKADKVTGATANNFAGLDANGNLKDSGKKASDFASAAEVANARGTYANLDARMDAQDTSQNELRDSIRVHKYGVLWNKSTAACTRLYDAVGLTANAHKGSYNASLVNDFDNLYPWSGRKLCNIDIPTYRVLHSKGEDFTGAIVAWEGDPDFSYTGSNGAVMVYTPEFWMRTQEVSGGVEYIIADGELPGYIHVPQIIGGRYFASADGDGVTSKAGVIPLVNTALSTIHSKAKAYDMTIDDIWTYCAETMLMVVEFANMNCQSALGNGVSSLYRQNEADKPLVAASGSTTVIAPVALANVAVPGAILDIGTSNGGNQVGKRIVTSITNYASNANYKTITFSGGAVDIATTQFQSIHGLSNIADEAIGSASGYIGTNGKSNAYYRGRVFHANLWRYVLGAYRQQNTGHIWVAHSREEAAECDALDTTKHIDTGCVLPYDSNGTNQEGWIKTLHFVSTLPLAPFCSSVGGNDSNPVGDYCYHPAKSAGNTILLVGGGAGYGFYAGRLCGSWNRAASWSSWYFAALPFLK